PLAPGDEEMQVLLGPIRHLPEVAQLLWLKLEAGFLEGFTHCSIARRFAGIGQALGDVPVRGTGGMAQQQFALRGQQQDAAAQDGGGHAASYGRKGRLAPAGRTGFPSLLGKMQTSRFPGPDLSCRPVPAGQYPNARCRKLSGASPSLLRSQG